MSLALRHALPLGLLGAAILLPQAGQAQALNVDSWATAANGDGLWLMEPLQVEAAQRGTWVRFNNVDGTAYASPGDVYPLPIEFESAFDPAWGGVGGAWAEIIVKVDGKVAFNERIPSEGFFPTSAAQVSAHRTAMIGIGQAPADGELTIECIGVLYGVGDDTDPQASGTLYDRHPYFGGSGANSVSVLRETRRVQHLRTDNPFIIENLAMTNAGPCPGPVAVSFVARTAYGGQNAAHPSSVTVSMRGLEDADGWDFSPAMGTFSLGPNDHKEVSFQGLLRNFEPCASYPYSADLTITASGDYNVIPATDWSSDVSRNVKDYWDGKSWSSTFSVGAGAAAKPM
ncbi:MAG: hypothetical protein ABI743_01835, partial [bacterium]